MTDLDGVRALAPQPTDESVTRTWYRITQLEAKRHSISRRRFLIPVAGAALTVLAAGSIFSIVGNSGDAPRYLAGTPLELGPTLDALAAVAAQTPPIVLPDGKIVYTEIRGWAAKLSVNGNTGELETQARQMWLDPNGGTPLRLEADGADLLSGPRAGGATNEPAAEPGVRFPTLAWLASLPTEPSALLAALRASTGTHDKWSVDQQLWDAMGGLYTSHEIALSPTLRAALFRSYKGINGLAAREITFDGRPLVAIRFVENDYGQEILFDPLTGRAVGRSSLHFGDINITRPSSAPADGPVAEPALTYIAVWTQQLVDRP
ncbi:hypothetical protein [Catelliglobosispora koreensis]|uniref:hypothetical protein n=1 Tax=Catelliglobosispora koreensis TaxID=129052 RepID=UPI000378FC36|nr:hypothetical protein [Catelliglobosispora koreensis]